MANIKYQALRKVLTEHTPVELLTNGAFTTDTVWVDYLNGSTGGSVVITGGNLQITQGTNTVWMGAYQAITTVAGYEYTISVDIADAGMYRIGASNSTSPGDTPDIGYLNTFTTGAASADLTFVATATTTYIFLLANSGIGTVDNYSNASTQLSGYFNYEFYLTDAYRDDFIVDAETSIGMDGRTIEVVVINENDRFVIQSTPGSIPAANLDLARELTASINLGGTFTFDPDGTALSPSANAVTVRKEPGSDVNLVPVANGIYYQFTITARMT